MAAIEAQPPHLLYAKGQGSHVAVRARELNSLVCELYGLTEEEIGIIEAKGGREPRITRIDTKGRTIRGKEGAVR